MSPELISLPLFVGRAREPSAYARINPELAPVLARFRWGLDATRHPRTQVRRGRTVVQIPLPRAVLWAEDVRLSYAPEMYETQELGTLAGWYSDWSRGTPRLGQLHPGFDYSKQNICLATTRSREEAAGDIHSPTHAELLAELGIEPGSAPPSIKSILKFLKPEELQ